MDLHRRRFLMSLRRKGEGTVLMVYDDDTGRPANFEIDPPGPDSTGNVPLSQTAQQIVDAAQQHPDWSNSDVAKHVSAKTTEKITADIVSLVLRHAQRDSRYRR